MQIDHTSKDRFTAYLQAKGFTNITETDQYCYYDLEAQKEGQLFRFELKQRTFPASRYNDAIMEQHKLNCFLRDVQQYHKAYLVTFFTDCWAISDILAPMGQSNKLAQHTTSFADTSLVDKTFIHYNLDKVYSYEDK